MRWFCIYTTALAIFSAVISPYHTRGEIFVFGDSLSDGGNCWVATGGRLPPTPLYRLRQSTDGPVWVEYFAKLLGEPVPGPSLQGGTNYAFSGSRAAGFSWYGTPNVRLQVSTFLQVKDLRIAADDYFVIWAGANDLFFDPHLGKRNTVDNGVLEIVKSIEVLHANGACKLIVLNLPPLGQTPYIQANPGAVADLDAASLAFNVALATALTELDDRHANLKIAQVDICGLFLDIQQHPQKFRLNNTQVASTLFDGGSIFCLGHALNPDVDPSCSLFWDGVHPTTRVHEVIGELAHQVANSMLNSSPR